MFSICYVTTPTMKVASSLSKILVQTHQVAACVNIIPSVVSVYQWEGELKEDTECLMMIKTQTSCIKDVVNLVKTNHPYDCPEIISIPMGEGYAPYLDWISRQTCPSSG
ncbi:unnamed protein product [Phytomonas sp. Hart1]|nr:unnamed protein product [Phytomonas sp. Hart1]|eukprot:CCW66580.1 unnamed protein product [Phytomonas sp. isolate Hart1]